MNPSTGINSVQWWNEYFRGDWEKFGGPAQTRHFMQRLIEALPAIDRALLGEQDWEILDWGTALGDGAAALAAAFPRAKVRGLDVSAEAIEIARQRHANLRFDLAAANDTPGTLPAMVDVVFNSNSIEHFDHPLDVVRANLARTRFLHLTLVPLREEPLSVHHRVRFDEQSFPAELAGFTRLFSEVVDIDPKYWPSGKQLLVGYGSTEYSALRAKFERSFSERSKWDTYYQDLALVETDPLTQAFNEELRGAVRELLPSGGSILEAGCGGGSQSLALARDGFAVTLLDFSPAALDYAKRLFDHEEVKAVFVQDDAFALRSAEHDLVFNAGVLEHYTLEEQTRFLRGMASRSRRYVLVLIPNRACYWYWVWRTRKTADFDWPFGKEVPQTSLADAFQAAGLDYLGQGFLGGAWTESFIESLRDIDEKTRRVLVELHRSPVVPAINKGYLMAALGQVPGHPRRVPARWGMSSEGLADLRRNEEWTALLADALAGRIAAEQVSSRAAEQASARAAADEREMADLRRQLQELAQRLGVSDEERVRLKSSMEEHLRSAEKDRSRLEAQLQAQAATTAEERTRLQHALSSRLDELNVANGKLIELNRQLNEVSQWGRQSAERVGVLQEQVRQLQAEAQRRLSARLRRILFVLRSEPPLEWLKRAYRRLPLAPATRHRIGVLARRFRKGPAPMPATVGKPAAAMPLATTTLPSGKGADVFVFAIIDWHFRIQRPQQIARALAQRGHRVFYVSNHFVDAREPGYQIESLDPDLLLYQVRLHAAGAPPIYFDAPSSATLDQLHAGLAKLLLAARPVRTTALVEHAWWWPLSAALPNATSMYDCMDHHEGFGNVPEALISMERRVVREADLVVVTSDWLAQRLAPDRPDLVMVRNGCDPKHFREAPENVHRDPKGRRTIGYYGAIAEWFDVDLVRGVAQAHPEARVLLVGNDTVGARDQLRDCVNVEFTGEVPYGELPAYVHAFDVCMLPFKVIPLTLATNPVKVYEYLAAGKPVVAVEIPEIAQFGGLVRAAREPGQFIAAVSAALRERQSADGIESRRLFAAEQSWARRAAAIDDALESRGEPRVSVIVLTYNNLHLTQSCLGSLERASDYPNLELIVVDNASTDGSRDWLRANAQRNAAVKLVLNDENLGFAAGNNIGLAQATGEYLVVLNNDTQVTHGWVRTLLQHFRRSPRLGLLGPVTSNIGNEAKIDIEYATSEEMATRAADYTLRHGGRRHPLRTAAFFCVMLRAAVYRQVGGLCEEFGVGFFEDDDYCRRVEAAGWEIACAEDVFVHHELSASFSKLPSAERQQIFERNLRLYETKWGKWEPHRYRDSGKALDRQAA